MRLPVSASSVFVSLLFVAAVLSGTVDRASAQIPDTFTNLQVLPEDIDRADLIATMRSFSGALGVRCTHCHVNRGSTFADMDFAADDKPEKEKARYMIGMLEELNTQTLPAMENRREPPVTMTCKTCHRGQVRPFLLSQEVYMAAHDQGADAAIARYRELRDNYLEAGAFDFRERETSSVAEALLAEGLLGEAIALYELNTEFHPDSAPLWVALAETYERTGATEKAIAAYERVLEINPNARGVQDRIDALKQ